MTTMGDRDRDDRAPGESLEDVQEMSGTDLTVYEAVAALNVAERPATVTEITGLAGLPEETVRHSLDALVGGGRLVPSGESYLLGPHDWGLDR
ncbi:hypothetical protein ACQP1K_06855 [Sphaerimonospora sp. CA-214678]|uniref:hypothetical protein n=1 Tax=Sphaerimonospora sp. CA-214678 TaxID=3240029 RepID=UPI003D8D520D